MERKRILLAGTNRSDPASLVEDGSAREIINLRPKNNAYRPVGLKPDWITEAGDVAYLHDINGRYMAAIFYDATAETWSYTVYDNGVKGTYYAITGGDIETLKAVSSLNNTLLIVFEESGTLTTLKLVFDLDSEQYRVFTELPALPLFAASSEAVSGDNESLTFNMVETWNDNIVDTVMGFLLKTISDKAEDYYSGPALIILAWELADGTEVKQSVPLRWTGSSISVSIISEDMTASWSAERLKLTTFSELSDLTWLPTTYEGIISSLNIYITKMAPLSMMDAEYTWANYHLFGGGTFKASYVTPQFPLYDAEALKNETLFYLLKKIPLSQVADTFYPSGSTGYVLEGPFGDLASRSSLTVNQGSHHDLSFNGLFGYNRRIFGYNVQTKLFEGFGLDAYILPPTPSELGVTGGMAYYLGAEIDIDTPEGIKTVFTGWSSSVNYYTDSGYDTIIFRLRRFYGYPDSRAMTMRLFYKNSLGNIYLLYSFAATKIESFNYAVFPEAHDNQIYELSALVLTPLASDNDTYDDKNRIQATAMDNIFSYPAENSYRVGNGAVLGLSTNAVALSSGQFGEYPLYCFTKDGIWTMQMGNGETLIDTIRPLSRDVCDNPDSILQIDGGSIFLTEKGLMMVSGSKIMELSEKAEGKYQSPLKELSSYKETTNDPNVVVLYAYLCSTDILTYLSGASLSYDNIESEIICSNPSYPYSWVYNMKVNAWHKITESFTGFVPRFPKNYGKRVVEGNTVLFDLTQEEYDDDIPVLFETRETKIAGGGFKKVIRSLIGCEVEHNDIDYRVSAQMFGTPDNVKWFRLSCSNVFGSSSDMVLGRSPFSCRRYIYLLCGKVKEGSSFTHIETDIEARYSDKLR